MLSVCVQSEMQVLNVLPSSTWALKAKPAECLKLHNGDLEAGAMDLHRCSGDLYQIFTTMDHAHYMTTTLLALGGPRPLL